jgi:hypothetical protein
VTGKVEVEFRPDVDTYWFHHRCYMAKATEQFILTSRTGIEFVDLAKKHWIINHWVRGACLYGTLPANGLLYAGPHDCACYPEAKLFGMNALAPARKDDGAPPPAIERLERGPVYGEKIEAVESDAKDWPIYRHDNTRSAFSDQPLLANMDKNWEVTLGGRLTPPVVAAGKLFVAQVDRHTLHAVDANSGKELWQYIAGGRIDSPPAYWQGRVYFGCMDGRVYCLRASDGALIWRFLAAPDARRHVAFEQLESVWPVHGSVVVENGSVNLVAGRSVFLDGGLRYYKLDAADGKQKSEIAYDDKDPETGKNLQTRLKTLQMPVGLNDILSSSGQYLYLRSQKIGDDGKRVDIGPVSGNAVIQGSTQRGADVHLFAPMGFLDDTWFHRSYWVYGRNFAGGHNGYYQAGKYTPTGQILAFDEKNVYSFGRKDQYFKWTTTIEDQLSAASREAPDVEPETDKPAKKKAAASDTAADAALADVPYVSFPDSDKLNPAGKPITVEVWVSAEASDGIIVSHGGAAQGYAIAIQDGKPGFSVCSTKNSVSAKSGDALEKGWHHLAGVLTAKSVRLYVDGKMVAEDKSPGLIPQKPKQRLQLGAGGKSQVSGFGNGKNYTGLIEQFTLYHRALSDKEIEERAKASARKTGTDAILACEFEMGTARDVSANKIHGATHDTSVAEGKFGKALAFRPAKELPKEAVHDTTSDEKDAGQSKEKAPKPDGSKGSFVVHEWTCPISIYGRAMAVAGDTVLVAGPPDFIDEESAFQNLTKKDSAIGEKLLKQELALEDKSGGSVMTYSTSGDLRKEIHLESSPVWDGMIVAQGRIYISSLDGKVRCFGKE